MSDVRSINVKWRPEWESLAFIFDAMPDIMLSLKRYEKNPGKIVQEEGSYGI